MLVIRCSRVNTFVSLVRTEGAGTRFRNLDGLRHSGSPDFPELRRISGDGLNSRESSYCKRVPTLWNGLFEVGVRGGFAASVGGQLPCFCLQYSRLFLR